MTEHGHHEHLHHEHALHGHSHATNAELSETLDLDARILGAYLDGATSWAAELLPRAPGTIIDVGAGSGAGTLALARRFPGALLTALDQSATMIETTLAAAASGGFEARVSGLQVNLDEGWPASASADLLWASSSLHELVNPEQAMVEMFAALNPAGLLLVLEMDSLPYFLPEDAFRGLESRLHEALLVSGWNHHPDWTAGLEGAGFVVERRLFPTEGSSTPELAARYARTFLGRMASALAQTASAGDLAALKLLLGDGPESVERRGDLVVRGNRTAWAARKP